MKLPAHQMCIGMTEQARKKNAKPLIRRTAATLAGRPVFEIGRYREKVPIRTAIMNSVKLHGNIGVGCDCCINLCQQVADDGAVDVG